MREFSFTFEAPKGSRHLRSGFFCIEVGFADLNVEALWWSHELNRWMTDAEMREQREAGTFQGASSSAPCRSFAAFRRHLRKHTEIGDRTVRLVSRYVGCDIYAQPIKDGR